jgi:chemotaxis protein MotB
VSKKRFESLQSELAFQKDEVSRTGELVEDFSIKLKNCEGERENLRAELKSSKTALALREEQLGDFKNQLSDVKQQRDKTVEQVGDLTVLSKSANDNINNTLSQLEGKDRYIRLLQNAKTKADSINLALAVNLKSVLKDGVNDADVDVKVDKTVVFINISDKMLFNSGSYDVNSGAMTVLGKIAKILQSKPNLEVMVEGYTDNLPIARSGITDNWDLSVKRSASVVRVLQKNFGIDPNRLIAAGRGEYNALADNATPEGRSANRRTRIILLPKLNEFYDLLAPDKIPE